jgi:hypothetical protein
VQSVSQPIFTPIQPKIVMDLFLAQVISSKQVFLAKAGVTRATKLLQLATKSNFYAC